MRKKKIFTILNKEHQFENSARVPESVGPVLPLRDEKNY